MVELCCKLTVVEGMFENIAIVSFWHGCWYFLALVCKQSHESSCWWSGDKVTYKLETVACVTGTIPMFWHFSWCLRRNPGLVILHTRATTAASRVTMAVYHDVFLDSTSTLKFQISFS